MDTTNVLCQRLQFLAPAFAMRPQIALSPVDI
jgi:hypothetical protein